MKTDLRLRLHATQAQPCFPAAPPRRQRHFHGNADRAYNTLHFASQSRVPNGGVAPFGNPPQEKAVRYPSTGRIPPFLVIQPSGCIGWAKVSVGMVWYLYLSESPDSHFEIAVLETNNASASSSCVKPRLFLNFWSFSWNSTSFTSFFISLFYC